MLFRSRQEQGRDLPWISGTRALAASVSFYAAAHPRYWSLWNASVETPWTDAQAVRRDGGFIVCAHDDEACVALATRWTAQQRTVAVAKSHLGWRFEPRTYRVFTLQPLPQP